jgi:hypothetical protein
MHLGYGERLVVTIGVLGWTHLSFVVGMNRRKILL